MSTIINYRALIDCMKRQKEKCWLIQVLVMSCQRSLIDTSALIILDPVSVMATHTLITQTMKKIYEFQTKTWMTIILVAWVKFKVNNQ